MKIGDWHDVHTEDALFNDTKPSAVTDYLDELHDMCVANDMKYEEKS